MSGFTFARQVAVPAFLPFCAGMPHDARFSGAPSNSSEHLRATPWGGFQDTANVHTSYDLTVKDLMNVFRSI